MKYPIESEENRTINRITFRQSFNDFLNAFNVERGLIYTLRNLFINPGELIRNYLGEGRYKVVNPFRLLILTTAVSLLVMYISDFQSVFNEMEEGFSKGFDKSETGYINEIMFDWYNLFMWLTIPVFGLCTFIFNKKSGYNYAESLVVMTFYLSGMNLLITLLMPLNLAFDNEVVSVILMLSTTFFYFYVISSFYQSKRAWFIVKNVFGYFIAYLIYYTIFTGIFLIFMLSVN